MASKQKLALWHQELQGSLVKGEGCRSRWWLGGQCLPGLGSGCGAQWWPSGGMGERSSSVMNFVDVLLLAPCESNVL